MQILLPDDWQIDPVKITDYLLDVDHKDGRAKAKAFLAFGFVRAEPDRLAVALFDHVLDKVPRIVEGRYGVRLVYEGPMSAPNGLIARVRSVWLMRSGERSARLVTAYPFDERR